MCYIITLWLSYVGLVSVHSFSSEPPFMTLKQCDLLWIAVTMNKLQGERTLAKGYTHPFGKIG